MALTAVVRGTTCLPCVPRTVCTKTQGAGSEAAPPPCGSPGPRVAGDADSKVFLGHTARGWRLAYVVQKDSKWREGGVTWCFVHHPDWAP